MTTSTSNQSVPPFPPFPSVARFVDHGSAKDTVARVTRAIHSGEALSLLIGPPGVGKSLVCNVLAKRFSQTHDVVMLGEIPITDAASYYRAVLHHLGSSYESVATGDLYVALVDRITGPATNKEGLLIIVDEAQLLGSDVLDAIRTTTNIMKDQRPYVSAIVSGGVKLEDTLATASMEPFTQRVATRCYLHPMNAAETRAYISESIRSCGSDPDATMTDEAMGAVHHACNGVPRLINQMMTEAIDCAADREVSMIDETVIDHAWAMLQQLPSPMVEEQKIAHEGVPVEFGTLSEMTPMRVQSPSESETTSEYELASDTDSQSEQSLGAYGESQDAVSESDDQVVLSIDADDEADASNEADISNEALLAGVAAAHSLQEAQDWDEATESDIEKQIAAEREFQEQLRDAIHETSLVKNTDEESACQNTCEGEAVCGSQSACESQADMADLMSTIVSVQMTPATSQLFGEFDAEESLSVQETLLLRSQAAAYSSTAPAEIAAEIAAEIPEETPAEADIETAPESIVAEQPAAIEPVAIEPAAIEPIAIERVQEVVQETSVVHIAAKTAPDSVDTAPVDTLMDEVAEVHASESIELEETLHQDVLSLNEMAAQARFGGIDPNNAFADPQQPTATSHDQPPIWLAEEEVDCQVAAEADDTYDLRSLDQELALAAETLSADTLDPKSFDDMALVDDDRDLLIIEDELDVVPRPHVPTGPAQQEREINVDFQAMLTRMRTGT